MTIPNPIRSIRTVKKMTAKREREREAGMGGEEYSAARGHTTLVLMFPPHVKFALDEFVRKPLGRLQGGENGGRLWESLPPPVPLRSRRKPCGDLSLEPRRSRALSPSRHASRTHPSDRKSTRLNSSHS